MKPEQQSGCQSRSAQAFSHLRSVSQSAQSSCPESVTWRAAYFFCSHLGPPLGRSWALHRSWWSARSCPFFFAPGLFTPNFKLRLAATAIERQRRETVRGRVKGRLLTSLPPPCRWPSSTFSELALDSRWIRAHHRCSPSAPVRRLASSFASSLPSTTTNIIIPTTLSIVFVSTSTRLYSLEPSPIHWERSSFPFPSLRTCTHPSQRDPVSIPILTLARRQLGSTL